MADILRTAALVAAVAVLLPVLLTLLFGLFASEGR
jgi:hypothetical protein